MGFDWLTPEHLTSEWRVITQAPVIWIASMVTMAALAYLAARWKYTARIEHLEERLRLRDDQIAALPSKPDRAPLVFSHQPTASENRSRTALKVPVTQISSAALPEPVKESSRPFLPVTLTPEHICAPFRAHTEARAKAITSDYIGKWIRISAVVENFSEVKQIGGPSKYQLFMVYLDFGVPDGPLNIFCIFDEKWRDQLIFQERGSSLNVQGRIEKIETYGITLINVELCDPSS